MSTFERKGKLNKKGKMSNKYKWWDKEWPLHLCLTAFFAFLFFFILSFFFLFSFFMLFHTYLLYTNPVSYTTTLTWANTAHKQVLLNVFTSCKTIMYAHLFAIISFISFLTMGGLRLQVLLKLSTQIYSFLFNQN